MLYKTCPACGLDSPGDRSRCYNCNASLEREPTKTARPSDAPTEKRVRPAVDLWNKNYAPPVAAQQAEGPTADPATAPGRQTGRMRPMAADAENFQPPRGRAGRGSSGDPSEIAPPSTKTFRSDFPSGAATPQARPRPKTEVRPAADVGTGAHPPGERKRDLGSGSHTIMPPRTRTLPAEPAVPDSPLLEPNRRKPLSEASGAVPATSSAEAPVEPADPPPTGEVKTAVAAANEAAKTRGKLDPDALASFAHELDELDDFPPPTDPGPAEPAAAPATISPEDAPALEPRNTSATMGKVHAPPVRNDPVTGLMPHYLVTSILDEPVQLARNQAVRIGRGEDNEIIFPLSQVSRRHAEVRWDQASSSYVVLDKNSINGTFVNGKSIRRRRLADGDRIGIGPFTVVYRVSTGGARIRSVEETDVIRPGSLAGEIAEMPMADIARFIESLKKTGELSVVTPQGERGVMFFREGQPVHAEFKVALGAAAAVALLRLKAGNFRFAVKTIELPKATIGAPLASLLAEAGAPPVP